MIKTTRTRGLMLVGALMLAATVATAEGRCYTAEVPGTMVLPDGSTHPPGALRICTDRAISPVSRLHRTDVAGRPVGMFLSTPRAIEETVKEGAAQFIFKRDNRDDLNLIGYVITVGNKTTFFEMARAGTVRETAYVSNTDANERDDVVVLVASGR